ncbi:MAG: gliding motility-associated lipoprotein GldK [Kordiimonas sp.]|nr:gliding motility-associated lipoprotein GldK [Kordiimonas sp.]
MGVTAVYVISNRPQSAGLVACVPDTVSHDNQVYIAGGSFLMGAEGQYPEEGPVRPVTVTPFWIDAYEVTNAQFARFVAETGYVTVAEQTPKPEDFPGVTKDKLVAGSILFTPPSDFSRGFNPLSWWQFVPGANWRHPDGPDSDLAGRDHMPVVHIAYADAVAYAQWAGRDLPTEEQWEYAARGGLEQNTYAWGEELMPDGKPRANHWQGLFPVQNTKDDGYSGMAPVGCFPANGYGLYDMIGNVWEWTRDVYYPAHDFANDAAPMGYDPRQPNIPVKVIKGGSFLCAPNYCMRYRPSARHAQDTGLGTGHVGFRTVLNVNP